MIDAAQIPAVARAASDNAPGVVRAVSQLFGLGQPQQNQLAASGVPGWVWMVGGAVAGTIAGVKLHRRWPQQMELIP